MRSEIAESVGGLGDIRSVESFIQIFKMSQETSTPPSTPSVPSTLPSCGKRPRSSVESFESMMCPVCQEYFVPPIVQCSKGHSVCYRCANNIVRLSGNDKCPICRAHMMPGCRNYALESQMQYITIGCVWEERGCKARITLSGRLEHELFCEFRPVAVNCYFNHPRHKLACDWHGNPLLFPKHLKKVHECPTIERDRTVKFLWNPPKEDDFRARYRVLKVKIPRHTKDTAKFLLEHVYFPEKQLVVFAVRTLEQDFTVPVIISIQHRTDPEHRLSLETKTIDFEKTGALVDYNAFEKGKVLVVPLDVITSFCFTDVEDENQVYFSLHIDFPTANNLTE